MSRILVVVPAGEERRMLAAALADVGHEALPCTPDRVVPLLDQGAVELLLVDLDTPEVEILLAALEARPSSPPLVGLGSPDDFDSFARGVQAGVIRVVARPFQLGQVVAACGRVLRETAGAALPEPDNRRREPRRALLVGVRLLSGPASMTLGEVVNISPGGAKLMLVTRFEVGARVNAAIDLPGTNRSLHFDGVVRWAREAESGFVHGLEFVELAEDVAEQIRMMLGGDGVA